MARKKEFTHEMVIETILALRKEGIYVTVRNIRVRMGGGDPSMICESLKRFLAEEAESEKVEIKVSDELLHMMKADIIDNVSAATESVRRQNEILEERCTEMQEIIVHNEQERAALLEENESLRKEKADIERRYQAEVVSLTERLASSDKSLKEIQSENATIIEQLEGLKVTTALATEEAVRLKASTDEVAQRNKELEKENKELRAVNSRLDKDFTVVTAEAAMLRDSIAKLEKSHQDSIVKSEKKEQALHQELKDSRSQFDALSAEHAKTMASFARVETKLNERDKGYMVLEERLRNLASANNLQVPPPDGSG